MKSKTSLVARQCRLQQWAMQIRECQNRPADMTVAQWCSTQGITTANYYYRYTEVRKACLDQIPEDTLPQSIVPVPQELIGEEKKDNCSAELEISANGYQLRLTEHTSPELLKMALQVISDVQ